MRLSGGHNGGSKCNNVRKGIQVLCTQIQQGVHKTKLCGNVSTAYKPRFRLKIHPLEKESLKINEIQQNKNTVVCI